MRYVASVAALDDGMIAAGGRDLSEPLGLHTTQRDDFRQRLYHTVKDLCFRVRGHRGFENISLCVGITGVNFEYDSLVDLPGELQKCSLSPISLACTGDIEIILASHLNSSNETASGIICNMGSTAFARAENGEIARVGGWGPAIGDDGSGFEMGKAALRAVGAELDEGEPPSILWKKLSNWLAAMDDTVGIWHDAACEWRCHLAQFRERMGPDADPRRALCSFVHMLNLRGSWRPVASGFTIPLMKAAEDRDRRALLILAGAAKDLAEQHKLAVSRCKLSAFEPVILYGGVLTHNEVFRIEVARALREAHGRDLRLMGVWNSKEAMRPAVGALLYALGRSSGTCLQLPPKATLDRVRASYRERAEELDIVND